MASSGGVGVGAVLGAAPASWSRPPLTPGVVLAGDAVAAGFPTTLVGGFPTAVVRARVTFGLGGAAARFVRSRVVVGSIAWQQAYVRARARLEHGGACRAPLPRRRPLSSPRRGARTQPTVTRELSYGSESVEEARGVKRRTTVAAVGIVALAAIVIGLGATSLGATAPSASPFARASATETPAPTASPTATTVPTETPSPIPAARATTTSRGQPSGGPSTLTPGARLRLSTR